MQFLLNAIIVSFDCLELSRKQKCKLCEEKNESNTSDSNIRVGWCRANV